VNRYTSNLLYRDMAVHGFLVSVGLSCVGAGSTASAEPNRRFDHTVKKSTDGCLTCTQHSASRNHASGCLWNALSASWKHPSAAAYCTGDRCAHTGVVENEAGVFKSMNN
jgi:hypothetical protein